MHMHGTRYLVRVTEKICIIFRKAVTGKVLIIDFLNIFLINRNIRFFVYGTFINKYVLRIYIVENSCLLSPRCKL
jgi:hypothetical protein